MGGDYAAKNKPQKDAGSFLGGKGKTLGIPSAQGGQQKGHLIEVQERAPLETGQPKKNQKGKEEKRSKS